MLGFSPVLLHAFSTMLGYSQLEIMYIILQHIFMFVSQEIGPGACCWHVLLSGSGALDTKTTQRGFHGLPGSQARALDAAKLLDADSCEDRRRQKFNTMCHDFWILNSISWNLDSRLGGCGTHVIDDLFFKFLEDNDQKIKD